VAEAETPLVAEPHDEEDALVVPREFRRRWA